jgi:hypothetical protein
MSHTLQAIVGPRELTIPDQPQFVLDWTRQWQAAEKIVYSTTLAEPRSARTRVVGTVD